MKLLVASAFAICLSLAAVSASRAMPVAPLDQAVSADTIRVAGGCGPGWHRGPYGGCRPNRGDAIVVVPGAVVVEPGLGPCGGRGRHRACSPEGRCVMVCN